MAAHRKSRKLIGLAAVLGLMIAAAFGGYAVANSRAPETLNLAGAQGGASGRNVTVHACLASGNLTHVSVATPNCPAKSVPVQWSVQSGPAASANPQSSSSPSTAPTSPAQAGTCTSSALKGSCGPYTYPQIQGSTDDPTVGQNVWSAIPGWHQTLSATGPGNWHVTANMPAGNTAVVSYPNTGAPYGEQSLSKFSQIRSSFSENMNATAGTSAWATYDLWFNNWDVEVMIQHDFAGNGPCDFVATQSFGGSGGVPVQTWGLCKFGDELIWKLKGGNEQTGSVDILSMITWLENHGYMASKSTITDLSYGFEICSTGGKDENFQVNSFSISAS
jgi:hypothetical protein